MLARSWVFLLVPAVAGMLWAQAAGAMLLRLQPARAAQEP